MSDEIPQHRFAWTAISRAHAELRRHIDRALKAEHLPPLEVFDALDALNKGATTAKRLEVELCMAQYAVSRLLDRMETGGLISRTRNRDDQRSKTLDITKRGQEVLHRQDRAVATALAGFFGPRAKPGQLERMVTLLSLLDTGKDTG